MIINLYDVLAFYICKIYSVLNDNSHIIWNIIPTSQYSFYTFLEPELKLKNISVAIIVLGCWLLSIPTLYSRVSHHFRHN